MDAILYCTTSSAMISASVSTQNNILATNKTDKNYSNIILDETDHTVTDRVYT